MKHLLTWLAPLLLAPAAASQASVTPLQAPPGKLVVIELVNNSTTPINVHCDA